MKEFIPIKDQKLIYLKWHDAHSAGGWHTKEQLQKLINEDICMCEEVGWVVYEDKDELVMCSRRLSWKDHDPEFSTAEFGLIQKIPKTWVKDRQSIILKKETR